MGIIAGHAGDNVECVTTEAAVGDGQAFFYYGHKTTWDMIQATVAALSDASNLAALTVYPLGNASLLHVWADCDTANATLSVSPVWFDINGHVMYVDDPIVIRTGTSRVSPSGHFAATGKLDPAQVNSATGVGLLITVLSPGTTWTLRAVPCG